MAKPHQPHPLPTRILGNTGLHVTVLSYGFGGSPDMLEKQSAKSCLQAAREAGINLFDIAPSPTAETIFGEILAELMQEDPVNWRRSDILISAKVPVDFVGDGKAAANGEAANGKAAVPDIYSQAIPKAVEEILARLQLEQVDFLVCHRFQETMQVEGLVRAMSGVIGSGKARHWGTSELSAQKIIEAVAMAERMGSSPPTLEQPKYNMFSRQRLECDYNATVCSYPYNLGMMTWQPMAGGLLTMKYYESNKQDDKAAGGDGNVQGMMSSVESRGSYDPKVEEGLHRDWERVDALVDWCSQEKCTLEQMAIAWCIRNASVTTTIVGATSREQLKENLRAIGLAKAMTDQSEALIEVLLGNKPEASVRPIASWHKVWVSWSQSGKSWVMSCCSIRSRRTGRFESVADGVMPFLTQSDQGLWSCTAGGVVLSLLAVTAVGAGVLLRKGKLLLPPMDMHIHW